MDAVLPPSSDPQKLERQKGLLIGITFGALLAVAAVTNVRASFSSDLAYRKPWRTSSTFATCAPALHTCASAKTDILFHTKEEDGPWFEVDLRSPKTFSSVEVTNRTDCCAERAQPLVVELSDDAKQWREVARNAEVFVRWTAKFAPQRARYVRLRVPKTTALHLEAIQVRE